MATQYSTTIRNNALDGVETTIGTAPKLQLFTGAQPVNCAAADSGVKVAEMDLPSDWLAAASNGAKDKSGTWSTLSALASGVIAHYRIKNSAGSVCHIQGSVTESGGGGDLIIENNDVNAGQEIIVTAFDLSMGGG
jgi:hypothetical protein